MAQKLTCTPDHAHRFIRIDPPKDWGEDGPEGGIRVALTATRCTLAALEDVIDRASAPRDGGLTPAEVLRTARTIAEGVRFAQQDARECKDRDWAARRVLAAYGRFYSHVEAYLDRLPRA